MNFEKILSYSLFGINISDIFIALSIVVFTLILSNFISKSVVGALKKISYKTKTKMDDEIISILESPLRVSIVLLGFYIAKQWLKLDKIDAFLNGTIKSLVTIIVFWIVYKVVDRFSYIFKRFFSKFGKELSEDIENFTVKTLKILVLIVGAMTLLQGWGINVSAFIASLGLVGMAFALAAKDTAANLFGSLVIFTDRPFKVGEWIETPNVEGTVEEIGIRSTRVRTFSQALVSVPNAVIANSSITNWSKMKKRRIKMRLGLTYSTTHKQMEGILKDLRDMLKNHPDIHKDTIMVYFDEFGDSALEIFCYFFTVTTNWAEFLRVKEDVNLKIVSIVEKHKASFAFPSHSLYIESMPD